MLPWTILFILTHVLDIVATHLALQRGAVEINPIANLFGQNFMIVYKCFAVLVCYSVARLTCERILIALPTVFFWILVVGNYLMFRHIF